MGASRYIGRVGGLAVAFGIGTAVFTGHGIASADTTSSGSESDSSSQGSSEGSGSSDSSGATTSTGDSTDSGSSESASVSDGEDAAADDAAAEDAAADDAAAEDAAADDAAADDAAADDAAADDAAAEDAAADDAAADDAAADDADEAAVADSASDDATTQTLVTAVASPVLDLDDSTVDPFAGGDGTPPAGSPAEAAAAAVARRELGIFADPITVDPALMFTEGVIYGNVNAAPGLATSYTYTLTDDPSNGGKIFLGTTDPNDPTKRIQDGSFNYLPFQDENAPGGTFESEQFTIMVSELSGLMKLLQMIPVLGDFVAPTVLALQETPFIGGLLQPIIGYRTFAEFDVNAGELAMGDLVAYTTMVTSFDGVQISTNWFPKVGLASDDDAPTIFEGPGLGANGNINPTGVIGTLGFVPGMSIVRKPPAPAPGFNYVSWDPRGEGASGGVLQLDNPFFEGRDVQAIIDYVATLPGTSLDDPGDPTMGMIGGSYGGGIQWVTAGIDKRVDTITPAASWNSLNESLYPDSDFKTSWGLLLSLDLLEAGARVNSEIYPAVIRGALLGNITESQAAILSSSGPTVLVDSIDIPALIVQGTVDGLFPLNQSTINAARLPGDPDMVAYPDSTRMIWACGGHGVCLTQEGTQATEQFTNISTDTMTWLVNVLYFGQTPSTDPMNPFGAVPIFQWYDQNNELFTSDLLPSDPAFYDDELVTLAGGGSLLLQPLCCGGSGPQLKAVDVAGEAALLVSPALAAPASQAINIDIPGPALMTKEVVGAPKLTMTYSGLGTSRHIYAQLVDNNTDLVLGNIITPVPVDLDGQTHQVEIDLEAIAYTMTPSDSLTLQIVGATSVYADATQWGWIDVSAVELALPTTDSGVPAAVAVVAV